MPLTDDRSYRDVLVAGLAAMGLVLHEGEDLPTGALSLLLRCALFRAPSRPERDSASRSWRGVEPLSPALRTAITKWVRARTGHTVHTEPRPWHARLGLEPDRKIARDVGISPGAVANARRKLGIPPHTPQRIPASPTSEWYPRLGHDPDHKIAADIGVSPSFVQATRRRLGIGPVRPWRRTPPASEWHHRLGREPDRQIAEDMGISVASVAIARKKLGIEPHRKHGPKP